MHCEINLNLAASDWHIIRLSCVVTRLSPLINCLSNVAIWLSNVVTCPCFVTRLWSTVKCLSSLVTCQSNQMFLHGCRV